MTTAPALTGADRLALYRLLLAAAQAAGLSERGDRVAVAARLRLDAHASARLLADAREPITAEAAFRLLADAPVPVRHLAVVYLNEIGLRVGHERLTEAHGGGAGWVDWFGTGSRAERVILGAEAGGAPLADERFALWGVGCALRDVFDGDGTEVEYGVSKLGSSRFRDAGIDPAVIAAACPEASDETVGRLLRRDAEEAAAAARAWDKTDWALVALAATAGVLADVALVRTPGTSPLTTQMHALDSRPGHGSPDDPAWFRGFAERAAGWEAQNKVPFDRSVAGFDGEVRWVPGMYPRSHRFQTPGHDPALGLVVGVRDILQGTMTAFGYDHSAGLHRLMRGEVWSNLEGPGLAEAVMTWARHLLSDVATPAGLPTPLFTALQLFNVGSFGEKGRSVAQVARWMYRNGYDLRHFATMGLTPAVVEGVLRMGVMLRRYRDDGEVTLRLARDTKYRAMRLAAHGATAAANGLRAFVTKNPLVLNQAQWAALARYALPEVVRYVYGRLREAPDPLADIREAGWLDLGVNARTIVEAACAPRHAPERLRTAA